MDKEGQKEEDEERYYGASGKKSFTGKSLEKTLFDVDTEDVSAEGGFHLAAVDSQGSVPMDFIQTGGGEG